MYRILTVAAASWLLALTCFAQQATPTPDDLLKAAQASYDSKQYAESAALYQRALPFLSDLERGEAEYNLACSLALAGDHGEALDTLHRAVDDGYTDRKDTETDRDLLSLHADPRWQSVLSAMSDVKAQQDQRWGDTAFDTPNAPNLSDEDKLAGLSELWAQAKFGFANFWHVPQLNWDQTYRSFIPQVLATKSTEDYYRVLQRFYALLHDGHSNVYTPYEISGKLSRLDLRTRLIDGHLLIIGSRSPAADLQGLRAGDEILTINGLPAVAWAEQNVEPYVSSSSQQDRVTRTFEYVPFLAPLGTRFTLGTEDPAGRQATRTFVVAHGGSGSQSAFEFRMLPGNVAYVALNSFGDNSAAKGWDQHWPEIQKAKALILDLRENGGGDDSVGFHILGALLTKDSPGELSRSTKWIATYRAWGAAETPLRFPVTMIHPDPARHFAGPVAMLISSRTFSAGEDMVVAFAQAHRGTLVGEPTGGSSGQPLTFKLPGGGIARICTKHDSFADGREFVGVGVPPDVPVHITRGDIVAGRDPVLERALNALRAEVREPGL
jgi:C-terminal processing protease CtpA/Prc